MRIGGTARYFADLLAKQDVEEAVRFAREKNIPLLPLGSGSNTIFSEGEIAALVVQVKNDRMTLDGGGRVTVGAGKNLPMLINELAEKGLDLSALTGIPGTVGGAIFGNAGQGPKGVWMDSFVESMMVYVDGAWKAFLKAECGFSYRESVFKNHAPSTQRGAVIWEATLTIPIGEPHTIRAVITTLLQERIETQPHLKTAGSCFKAVGDTPVWQLIDVAGLRGFGVGGIEISPKHANFLMNTGSGTFADAVAVVEEVKKKIPENLEVEMRFIEPNGSLKF